MAALSKLTKPGRYRDKDWPRGLYLQIGPTGKKSWALRYEINGRDRRLQTGNKTAERMMGLGPFPEFSFKQARERALAARQLLADKVDPVEQRKAERDAQRREVIYNITFKQAAEQYIALHSDGWRNAKHRQQWNNTLRDYAFPALAERLVSGIDAAAINDAVAPIWRRIPDSAARTKGRIERVVQWVKDGMPLPKPPPSKRVRHQPAMPYEQLPEFMVELRAREGVAPRALEFLILTAGRTGEVIGATWDEVDFDRALWRVPAARMKSGRAHEVPLSDRAVLLLKALPREKGNKHLFIGGRPRKPLSDMAMLALMRRMRPDYVPHGFRSSFRDWAGDMTNFPREVAEAALAHTIKEKTEAAYRRATALEKRRKLMAAWARYCASPVPAGEVVSLAARRTR